MLHSRSREAGIKGGKKVAEMYGQAFCEERAQKGGQATLVRYGRQYFRAIRKLRKK